MSKRKAEDEVEDDAAKKQGKSASISDPDSYLFVQIDNADDNSPTIFYIKHKTVDESDPDWPEVVEQLCSGKLLGDEFQCLDDDGRIFKYDGSIEKGKELLLSKGFNYDEDLKVSDNEEGDDGSEDDSEEGDDDDGDEDDEEGDEDDDEEGDEEGDDDDEDEEDGDDA